MEKRKGTTTDMVREYAAAAGTFKKIEAQTALGLTVDQIKRAVDTLYRQGYLRRIRHGLYQANSVVESPGAELNDKIWRAMKVSSTFSAADIAKLADSTRSYVYKRFRAFRADGFIKPAGVRPSGLPCSQEKLWRLTPKGKEKALAPAEEAFAPDGLVMAAVNLNRLICSGLAARSAESAKEALVHVAVIREAMKEVLDEA
jgi:DNA-binding MarR family transcriptional regulator